MITLGVIGFVFRDFAAVWGPLPNWVPWHTALACVCAAVALAASLVLFVYVGLWWLLLKVPEVLRAPRTDR